MPVAVDETRLERITSTGVLHTGNILGRQLEAIESLLEVPSLEGPPITPVSNALSILKKWADIAAVSPQTAPQAKVSIGETSQCSGNPSVHPIVMLRVLSEIAYRPQKTRPRCCRCQCHCSCYQCALHPPI